MITSTHHWSRRVRRTLGGAALLAGLPLVVAAQVGNSAGEAERAEADEMHQRADLLMEGYRTGEWKQAAHLYERAAGLRATADEAAIQERTLAGTLLYYVGSLAGAQENLETAAELALSFGRVLESAELFLKAAFVAEERERPAEVLTLADRALQLASSPHLSQAECDGILGHILSAKVVMREKGGP